MEEQDSFFLILSFSMFSDVKGPVPVYCYPESINESTQVEIAMKSVSLLMGEAVYQTGLSDDLKFFGVLPFPDLKCIGLTYFFLIPDENARGKSKAATISIIVKESNHHFIYDNIHTLQILLDIIKVKLRNHHDSTETRQILETFRTDITSIHTFPFGLVKHTGFKIIIAGLHNSGKTSFRKSIAEQFSQQTTISMAKTRGYSERQIIPDLYTLKWKNEYLDDNRTTNIKNDLVHLNEVDLLYYIIDIQDPDRYKESLTELSQILLTFENLHKFPPILIALHKSDPDIAQTSLIRHQFLDVKTTILKLHSNWDLKVFQTSIYDSSSLLNCISYGFFRLFPNQVQFSHIIKTFIQKLNGHIGILFTRTALTLGKYSINSTWAKFVDNLTADLIEMAQNSENLYNELIPYQIIQIDGEKLVFYRFFIDRHEFYLFFDTSNFLLKINKIIKRFQKKIIPLIRKQLD